MRQLSWLFVFAIVCAAGCTTTDTMTEPIQATPAPSPALEASIPPPAGPTAEEARRFVNEAEARLDELNVEATRAAWIQANFITEDTQAMSAAANEKLTAAGVQYAKDAARFNSVNVDADTRRK